MSSNNNGDFGFWTMLNNLFSSIRDIDIKLNSILETVHKLEILTKSLQNETTGNKEEIKKIKETLFSQMQEVDKKFTRYQEVWKTYKPLVYLLGVFSFIGAVAAVGLDLLLEAIKKIIKFSF